MSPLVADTVGKVGNRAVAKISRKSIFSRLRRCNALQDRYDGLWSFFCETMWSLTSPREGRTSGPEKFPSAVKKDFFNTIGTFETCRRALRMSVHRGRPEVTGRRSERRD